VKIAIAGTNRGTDRIVLGHGWRRENEARLAARLVDGINASQAVGRVDRDEKPALPREGGPVPSTGNLMIASP